MSELRRFKRQKTIILIAGSAVLVVGLIGVLVLGAKSEESGPVPVDLQSGQEPPTPASSPSAHVSGGQPSSGTGTSSGGQPSSGTGTSRGGGPSGPAVTDSDPDQPVSSEDPPTPTRPRPSPPDDGIDSFEDCARAGYPIAESYPEQCFTPDGRSFTRTIP